MFMSYELQRIRVLGLQWQIYNSSKILFHRRNEVNFAIDAFSSTALSLCNVKSTFELFKMNTLVYTSLKIIENLITRSTDENTVNGLNALHLRVRLGFHWIFEVRKQWYERTIRWQQITPKLKDPISFLWTNHFLVTVIRLNLF